MSIFYRFFFFIFFLFFSLLGYAKSPTIYIGKGGIKEIALEDFSGTEKYFTLNGVAKFIIDEFSSSEEETYILRLTPRIANTNGFIAGSAFLKLPFKGQKTDYKFSTFFRYRVTASSIYDGSGMVFVIQSDKRKDTALGKCEYCMGFSGSGLRGATSIRPSLGIEFDIQESHEDTSYNMIGMNFNGLMRSVWPPYGRPYSDAPINNSIPWNVWIDYDGKMITVRSSQKNNRAEATLHINRELNLSDTMSANKELEEVGEPDVYIGFTADPGLEPAYTDILEWHFKTYYAPYGNFISNE